MTGPAPGDVASALHSNPLFEELNDQQLENLAGEVWLETIPGGSVIVREGEEADALYVVVNGGVNVTKAGGQFLAFLGPGGFFGEMALFLANARRSATCVSSEDTTCAIIRSPVLHRYCNDWPDAGLIVYRAIIRTLAERLQSTSADLAYLMGAQVRDQARVDQVVEATKKR
jgi:CRP-like cAMP-binding protein